MKTFKLFGSKFSLTWRGLEVSRLKMWGPQRVVVLRWWKPGIKTWKRGEVSTTRTPEKVAPVLDIPLLYIDGWHEIGKD